MFKRRFDLSTIVCFCLVVFLLVGILGRILGYEIRKDEQLYVPPAVLLSDMRLYHDFFYNHVPVSAWYFFGLNEIMGGSSPFLAARLGVFLAWIALALSVAVFLRKLTGSQYLGYFASIALLANIGFHDQSGMTATNNFLPLPVAFTGLAVFCWGVLETNNRFWKILLAGVCLSLAAAIKANALFIIPPVAIAAFYLPREISFVQRLRSIVVPLAMGGFIGAFPVFIYLFNDPENFLAHVVKFHTGPHVDYWETRILAADGPAFYLREKVLLAFSSWFASASFLLFFICCYLAVFCKKHTDVNSIRDDTNFGLIVMTLGCLVTSACMSFIPTPSFPQYFMQSIICLPLLIALIFNRLDADQKIQTYPVLTAAIVLLIFISLPRLAPGYLNYLKYDKASVNKVHKSSTQMREIMAAKGLADKVITFLPIYALESGLPVYPEFATGEFAYRIWPYLSPELERHYVTTNQQALKALLADNPPDAILVGFLETLEQPLVQFAIDNNYQIAPEFKLKNRYGNGVLYLRPSD